MVDQPSERIKDLFYPSDRGALVRAAVLPGWGHRYKQRKNWSYFWGGLFWSAAGFTAFATAQYLYYSIAYRNYTPEHHVGPDGGIGLKDQQAATERFRSLASNAQSYGRMTLVGIISVAVIYTGNLLHAFYIKPDIVENPDFTGLSQLPKLRLQIYPDDPSGVFDVGQSAQPRSELSVIWRF